MSALKSIAPLLLLLPSCGWLPADGPSVPVAHQAGAGWWPQNSRTAVYGALDQGYRAIEVDLFLANDRVPVLSDTPSLDPALCQTAGGGNITEDVWLLQQDRADLDLGWRCGGLEDPAHPDAERVADTLMDLDELLRAVEDYPEVVLILDVRYLPNVSHDPEVYAAEILERWWAADLPNALRLTANLPETIRALEARADLRGRSVRTLLQWPRVPPRGSAGLAAIGTDAAAAMGTSDALHAVDVAHADGLIAPWRVAERGTARAAQSEGIEFALGTFEDDRQQTAFDRWGADWLFTDVPEPAP